MSCKFIYISLCLLHICFKVPYIPLYHGRMLHIFILLRLIFLHNHYIISSLRVLAMPLYFHRFPLNSHGLFCSPYFLYSGIPLYCNHIPFVFTLYFLYISFVFPLHFFIFALCFLLYFLYIPLCNSLYPLCTYIFRRAGALDFPLYFIWILLIFPGARSAPDFPLHFICIYISLSFEFPFPFHLDFLCIPFATNI